MLFLAYPFSHTTDDLLCAGNYSFIAVDYVEQKFKSIFEWPFFFEKTPNGNVFFEPDTVLHVGLKTITNCHYSSVERMKIWGYEMYILLAVNRSLTFVHANNDCSNSRIITLNSQSMIKSCSILENLFVSLSK